MAYGNSAKVAIEYKDEQIHAEQAETQTRDKSIINQVLQGGSGGFGKKKTGKAKTHYIGCQTGAMLGVNNLSPAGEPA
jgi:hypothetical protein